MGYECACVRVYVSYIITVQKYSLHVPFSILVTLTPWDAFHEASQPQTRMKACAIFTVEPIGWTSTKFREVQPIGL